MSTLASNQRNQSRQQTFYSAFAYVRNEGTWARYAVKVFDQSFNGVRLRAMHNLSGDDIYVQLDMTSPVLTLCEVRRRNPVARNCWEFGIELCGVIEIQNVIPIEIIERFCDAGTSQHVEAVSNNNVSPVDELADLLTNQLGLESPVTPSSDMNKVAESNEAQSEPNAITALAPAPLVQPLVQDEQTNPVVAESVVTEPVGEPELEAAPAIPEEQASDTDTASSVPSKAEEPMPAIPAVQFHPRPQTKSEHVEPPKPSFIKTVMIGFARLGGLLVSSFASLKNRSKGLVPRVAFRRPKLFANKTSEDKRREWLQVCAQTVNPPDAQR
ncbi:MAG: hypothetical protein AB8G99_04135 [Planctomycetaceae bacterium]